MLNHYYTGEYKNYLSKLSVNLNINDYICRCYSSFFFQNYHLLS